ncbi:hypothetical protein HS048_34350 [Planomonospora sp. ID91781]|uniref:hypothetical protein n=1 Tax=Planomonospora sp. ID91781 TaxID=2738135 RepID=UPI0018C35FB1|nr:hypothetical protein [Planomonospora sp. ID91781]MBG0825768.1 hypothetical protein [Planomonospora sp. ID91781]
MDEPRILGRNGMAALDAIPQLLTQLRAAHRTLDDWRSLTRSTEYIISATAPTGDEPRVTEDDAERAHQEPGPAQPWARTVHTSPWAPWTPPPF